MISIRLPTPHNAYVAKLERAVDAPAFAFFLLFLLAAALIKALDIFYPTVLFPPTTGQDSGGIELAQLINQPLARDVSANATKDITPLNLRAVSIPLILLVIAIVIRIELLRYTLGHIQCAKLGVEAGDDCLALAATPLTRQTSLPTLIALYDCWRTRKLPRRDAKSSHSLVALGQRLINSRARYLLPALLSSSGGYLAAGISPGFRSTYICPRNAAGSALLSQFLGVLLEFFIICTLDECLWGRYDPQSQKDKRAPAILVWVFLVCIKVSLWT